MKRMVAASVVALATAQFGFGQNLLANGDLEQPAGVPNESHLIDSWTLAERGVDGAGAPLDTGSFTDFANHTTGGARGFWFRSFMGGLVAGGSTSVDAVLTQAVPGTPGQQYSLSAWYKYETFYSGLDPFQDTQTLLAIDFLDGGGNVLQTQSLDIDTVQVGDLTFRQFSVDGIAPAGTAHVQARAAFLNGVLETGNPQSAFVDDFSLVAVPEPTTIACLIPALALLFRRR